MCGLAQKDSLTFRSVVVRRGHWEEERWSVGIHEGLGLYTIKKRQLFTGSFKSSLNDTKKQAFQ